MVVGKKHDMVAFSSKFRIRSCWLQCFAQTAERRLRPKRTSVRWDVVKGIHCRFMINKVFQYHNPPLESPLQAGAIDFGEKYRGFLWTWINGRLSVKWLKEILENHIAHLFFSNYCQTVSDDWIFPIKKPILSFLCWQMKRNKIFYLDHTLT